MFARTVRVETRGFSTPSRLRPCAAARFCIIDKSLFWKFRMFNYLQASLNKFFNASDIIALLRCRERYSAAFVSGAACTADTMDIILCIIREVIVYNKLYACDIDAPGGNISGNKYLILS